MSSNGSTADNVMNKIALIYMGGTFGCVGEALAPMPEVEFLQQLKRYLPEQYAIQCFATNKIQDSSACSAEDWLSLVQQIQSLEPEYQHFVVIHGTDTLSYAAATLARFLQHSCRVILTGSQFPLLTVDGLELRAQSDALDNLHLALEQVQRVNAGVYLAFHQQIFHAASCLKLHSTRLDAFHGQLYNAADPAKPIAAFEVEPQHIQAAQSLNIVNWMMQPISKDQLATNLEQLIPHAPQFLILQGYGTGNIAVNPRILAALRGLREQGCISILTSQVALGSLDQRYAVSQWALHAEIFVTDSLGHADLYAKILKIYLQYRTPDQCAAHWYDHHL
ncbi:L-asparaginase [Acinetobacter calcoaceticus]|uniref:L-asparaginase n=1 Tax=Acinetobacter calcoaceticus TaxID=471 RepID=A0A4R1XX50_ACICA|nr:L-asparaginase [Acinetobacter calcoaceticus]